MARIGGHDWSIYRRYGEGRQTQQSKDREEDQIAAPEPRPLRSPFFGGPPDTSILVRYQDHVARHL